MEATKPLDEEKGTKSESEKKPCRACTDFKHWVNTGAGGLGQGSDRKQDLPHQKDIEDRSVSDQREGVCPPDRQQLGASSWALLHSVAAYYPDRPSPQTRADAALFLSTFSRLYPCQDCAEDLRADLKESPPRLANSKEFSLWLCQLHNKVNVKLGKPTFDCSKVFERWRDGWSDGSCD